MIGIAPKEWKTDLPEFCEKTRDFYAGKMDKGSYKGFSGRYGSYAQKGGAASMLRLRMTAGCVSKEKLAFIAKAIRAYQVNMVHFTTCESVQFHNLDEKSVCELMEQALDAGIVTMGGGGDFPRNVMCSPLSGVEEGEYFDVMPWAKAAGEYLMTFINAEKMPRKLKVCFSNSPANVTHATRLNAAISAYCSSAEALAALSASSICWWRSLRAASPVAEDRLADLTLELATTAAARSASRFIEASSVADTAGISPSVIEVPLFPSKMASWRSALFA